jgi:hypothetical protein
MTMMNKLSLLSLLAAAFQLNAVPEFSEISYLEEASSSMMVSTAET